MKKQANRKNPGKKSHKKLWIILGIVAVIVVVLVIMAVRGIQNMAKEFTQAMDNTVEVKKGEIDVTAEGIGVIETAKEQTIFPDYNVTISKLYKQDGQQAAAGEVIAEYESLLLDDTILAMEEELSQLDMSLSGMTRTPSKRVKAPVTGRVKEIYAAQGDSVLALQQEQKGLALISADGTLKVEFSPEAEVKEGQKVSVGYQEDKIEGRIHILKDGKAAAVFEDSDKYELGQEASVLSEDGASLGTGTVSCGHGVYVTAKDGVIKSVQVKKNDWVSAGNSLFSLEDVYCSQDYVKALERREELQEKLDEARAYKEGFCVTAPWDCIISGLVAKEGETLPAGSPLCVLLEANTYQAVLSIDELDIRGIDQGQSVEVTVDAVEDATYQGTVTGVSLAGENTGNVGTYQVRVLLEEGEDLLPGMSANGKVTKEQKKDVLLAPVDTIQTIDGKKKVTVVKPDGTRETREVTLGLVNNEYAEVLEGLQEGEKLQVIVKLTDIYSQMGITVGGNEEQGR